MSPALQLVAACAVLVVLTFVVGVRMLGARAREMRARRIGLQSVSTSVSAGATYRDVQAADNFRNLFEVPVLFYALAATALATAHVPGWLALGAWLFVALRVAHSAIHCTYNRVAHRFAVFATGFFVLVVLWIAFFVSLAGKAP